LCLRKAVNRGLSSRRDKKKNTSLGKFEPVRFGENRSVIYLKNEFNATVFKIQILAFIPPKFQPDFLEKNVNLQC
jgi:hypothetical protein